MRTDPLAMATLMYLLKATAILLLTLGVTLLLRRASAGTRHLAWLAAVVVVLAMPVLGAALPEVQVVPLPATASPSTQQGPTAPMMSGSAMLASLTGEASGSTTRPAVQVRQETGPMNADRDRGTPGVAARVSAPHFEASWGRILFLLWLSGVLLVLGRLAHSAHTLRGILRGAEPLTAQGWINPLYEAADRLDLKEAPRLFQSERVAMPFACGLLNPTIVVPASAEEWTATRRRAVLFHELAHIRRRDLVGHALGRVACALYWMHPLVWAAAYRLRSESERACDDLVLSTGTPASEYADHLLQILVSVRSNDAPAVALPMGRRREFEGRLLAILDPALRRHRPTAAHGLLLVTFFLASAAVVALAPREASGTAVGSATASQRQADTADVATWDVDDSHSIRAGENPEIRSPDSPPEPGRKVPSAPTPKQTYPHTAVVPHLDRIVENFATGLGNELGGMLGDVVGSGLQIAFGGAPGQPKNIPLLVRLLESDPSAEVRRTAAWGLYDTGDDRATAALVRAVRADESADVREMAVWALHDTSGEAVRAALTAATQDEDPRVRASAVWGLGHSGINDPELISTLAARLADPHAEVRLRAAWSIGHLHPDAAPPALYERALSDSDAEVRVAAGWALGQIADPAAQPALDRALLEEQDAEALRAVVYALHRLGPLDPAAVESLLSSDDEEIRTQAIRVLTGAAIEFEPWPWPWPEPRPFP